MLGFFLPLIGLIIGAIIGKGEGVKHALAGIVLRYVLIIGGCLWVFNSAMTAEPEGDSESLATGGGRSRQHHANERKTWEMSKSKSPLDDSTIYTIRREAAEPVHGAFDKMPPVLILRRKEGESDAYISWPIYIGHGETPVTIRFDDDDAVTEDWNCSTDGKAVFSPFPFS